MASVWQSTSKLYLPDAMALSARDARPFAPRALQRLLSDVLEHPQAASEPKPLVDLL